MAKGTHPPQQVADARKARVFISYARKYLAIADRLLAALQSRGFEAYLDTKQILPGEPWRERLSDLISKADTVVFLISPESLLPTSVCDWELNETERLAKRLLPVVVRRAPDEAVPSRLRRLNWIFLDDDALFDAGADRIAEALITDIAWIRKHTEIGEAARRWAVAGRPGPQGLLLRSPLLEDAERWIGSRPINAWAPTEDMQAFIVASRRAATQRRNTLTASLAVGLLVALGLAGLAFWQRAVAIEQRNTVWITQSRFLADLGNQNTNTGQATLGVLLALEALPNPQSGLDRPYVAEAEAALFNADQKHRELGTLTGHSKEIGGALFSTDGRQVVTVSRDKTVRLWDVDTASQIALLAGHTHAVVEVAFSPDGRRIYSGSLDGTVRVWNTMTRQPEMVLKLPGGPLNGLAVSADGSHLVTALGFEGGTNVWDAGTGKITVSVPGYTAALSRDGQRLVTADRAGAYVWDAATGQKIADLQGLENSVVSVAFSPDGRLVATASGDARIWNAQTGQQLVVVGDRLSALSHVSFSPDGRSLATLSGETAQTWDVETGEAVAEFKGHGAQILQLTFRSDGRLLLTSSQDKTARLWDAASGRSVGVLAGHDARVWKGAFSADGRRAVTASDDTTARLWDVTLDRTVTALGGFDERVSHVAFSADGERVMAASDRTIARLWKAATGEPISTIESPGELGTFRVAFSSDGRRAATVVDGRTVQLWNADTGQSIAILDRITDQEERERIVSSIAFTPHDRQVVTTDAGHRAKFWNAATGQPSAIPSDLVGSFAFSDDGRRLITSHEDSTARLWDVDSGQQIAKLPGISNIIAMSFDGQRVLTRWVGVNAQLWSTKTGQRIASMTGKKGLVQRAAFSSDGKRILIAAGDNTARLWDGETGQLIADIAAYGSDPASRDFIAEFSADGRRIVTAAHNTEPRLWDGLTGAPIAILAGHTMPVVHAAFSRDGLRVITASLDSTARIWDGRSGKALGILEGHASDVLAVAFDPDRQRVVTGSLDSTARLWRLYPDIQQLVEHAKRIVPRCLTLGQRAQFFLDPEPPTWCIAMGKQPYQTSDWKDWLEYKSASANPPLPDTAEWLPWLAKRRPAVTATTPTRN
jgi:WD40 repeat protein